MLKCSCTSEFWKNQQCSFKKEKIMNAEYMQMTDDQIVRICRLICRQSRTAEDAKLKIRERFGTTSSIAFSKPNEAGQKMKMGMIPGPKGNTISF